MNISIDNVISLIKKEGAVNDNLLFFISFDLEKQIDKYSNEIKNYLIKNPNVEIIEGETLEESKKLELTYSEHPILNARDRILKVPPYELAIFKGMISFIRRSDKRKLEYNSLVTPCSIEEAKQFIESYEDIFQAYWELNELFNIYIRI